jgi:uncharacterized protein YecE (DUF72 family)
MSTGIGRGSDMPLISAILDVNSNVFYNKIMGRDIYIGTSGWHYHDWTKLFYPPDITGYRELTFHAQHFNTVENNSSFYRIASEETYKTWYSMTPDGYKFSLKLNKLITHTHRLGMNNEVIEKVRYILETTQVLRDKLGAVLIQLPASFKYDPIKLDTFLDFFVAEVRSKQYKFDIAIEFRNKYWFTQELFSMLQKYNVALVAGQSSRWPGVRRVTADIAYIRMHGPEKLFASLYSTEQLAEWAMYIAGLPKQVQRVYVYFNNDFHGYALQNAKDLAILLASKQYSLRT